jgi:hypothetical protein
MTPLDKPLKRALKINGVDYVVSLSPEALKITLKGHRVGVELKWIDLTSGESALAVALRASLGQFQTKDLATPPKPAAAVRKPAGRARRLQARSATRKTRS